MTSETEPGRPGGLFGSVRRMFASMLGVLQTRLEIFSLDFAEERFNLVRMAVVVLTVLFCLQTGVFLTVLFIVLAVAGPDRLAAIGIAALSLLLLALVGTLWLWRWLKTRPPLFAGTIAELQKDRDQLSGKS